MLGCFMCIADESRKLEEVVTEYQGTPLCSEHAKLVMEKNRMIEEFLLHGAEATQKRLEAFEKNLNAWHNRVNEFHEKLDQQIREVDSRADGRLSLLEDKVSHRRARMAAIKLQ